MDFRTVLSSFLSIYAALGAGQSSACSSFAYDFIEVADLDAQFWLANSYDWTDGQGHIHINRRGRQKQSLLLDPTQAQHVARWAAKYGSVTFNQFGKEMPIAGMNEAGLVVETQWLDTAEYERPDQRPFLNELQFTQYLLDTASTAQEAAVMAMQVRVTPVFAKVHYLICDARAECVIIEHIDGRLIAEFARRGLGANAPLAERPASLTNGTYLESKDYMNSLTDILGDARSLSSLDRFARGSYLAATLSAYDRSTAQEKGLSILESVRDPSRTQWQLIYDQSSKEITYRTRESADLRTVRFSEHDFACQSPTQMSAIDQPRWEPYDSEVNKRQIVHALRVSDFVIADAAIDYAARFHEAFDCE